jgi:hypothetical protein
VVDGSAGKAAVDPGSEQAAAERAHAAVVLGQALDLAQGMVSTAAPFEDLAASAGTEPVLGKRPVQMRMDWAAGEGDSYR